MAPFESIEDKCERLEKELEKARLSIDTIRDTVNRAASTTIPDYPRLNNLTICGKVHMISESHGGLKLACQDLHEIISAHQNEVASVLMLMDGLAEQWGDEGVFRRCRDRLRAILPANEESTDATR